MIVRDKPKLFQLFFIMRGSVVPLILPQIVFVTALGGAVAYAHQQQPDIFPQQTLAPFTMLGLVLSLFLGFRNNASYERWWEARKQWGQLIVDSRSIARQVSAYIDPNAAGGVETQQRLVRLCIAFSHALRHKLRGTQPWEDIRHYVKPEDTEQLRESKNLPDSLLRLTGTELRACHSKALLPDFLIQAIDEHITSMAAVQAACERIQNTPLPFAYTLLVRRTTYFYCLILPFGLVSSQGMVTPLFCAIFTYTFFGLDALTGELEDPFGTSNNDLPLSAMSRTIEIDLLDALGDENIPEPLQAEAHYLD